MATEIKAVLQAGCEEGVFPGCAYAWGTSSRLEIGAVGTYRYDESPRITAKTLFDVASLTKVMATTPVAMLLERLGRLSLDAPVARWVPEYGRGATEQITVRHLLQHNSGLPAYAELWESPDAPFWPRVLALDPVRRPGEAHEYSCLSFLILQRVLESASGMELGPLAEREVFLALGLADSRFSASWIDPLACAPTERIEPWRAAILGVPQGGYLQGCVHDPLAFLAGGYAGNAGVFAPIQDVGSFAQAALRSVLGLRSRFFDPEQLRLWSRSQGPGLPGLGWDVRSPGPGSCLSPEWSDSSFGHLGYTGTSLWVDPKNDRFAVLLSARVHPTHENRRIVEFRPRFHQAVAQATA
ncbi:MAG TPA: serine hydrolase domain-containing protein [Fimbriimonadaceae bacterium]|nr:serine hydrolase domain-containing protein [Fimbriimonadaceae bacterium]HRJ34144.1 serine hydrolase domain-containing protein [Fimbriimonadaceae bacterium]